MTRSPITVAATMPPPVDGMTLATSIVVSALRERCELRVLNWSPGPGPANKRWRLRKGVRSLSSVLRMAFGSRHRHGTLYTVANSRGGLYYNLLLIAIARLRRYRIILHHQVYSYLHRHDWRMRWLDRWLGSAGTHVVLSDGMEADFRRQYQSHRQFFVLPNTIVMLEIEPPATDKQRLRGPFRLGHCSNLSVEKGLVEVLETVRELASQGQDVQLVLAGPFVSRKEEQLVQAATHQLGPRLDYRGPVYGQEKQHFFRDLDVMLFPTRYQNEAQPLVLAEAMAYGKPVIAFDRGCIRSLVGQSGGQVISEQDGFPKNAVEIINHWLKDSAAWETARDAVQLRAQELRSEASIALSRFVEFATTPPRSGRSRNTTPGYDAGHSSPRETEVAP